MPLLLRFASHSSFACGLRARLGEARNRSANQPLADCSPHPVPHPFKTFADCKTLIEPQRSEGRDNKGANRHRGGSGGNFPRMRQPWRNTSASFAIKGGRGRRIAPLESNEPHAIKRGHTKSKIPLWRASVFVTLRRDKPGCGGGVSPCKKKRNHAKYQKNRLQTAYKDACIHTKVMPSGESQ